MVVLEGIEAKEIVASSDYYCSEDDGVTITVVDPQVGITYAVENRSDLAPITATEGAEVSWSAVRLADATTTNPETFNVQAYYESLPDQIFDMANTVTVEEVTSPATLSMPYSYVSDCSVTESPDFTWTLENAESTIDYFLTFNGTIVSDAHTVANTGESIAFNIYEIMTAYVGAVDNGTYKVVAYAKRQDGTYVCEKIFSDSLYVERPTTEQFEVKVSPENGLICVDDADGYDIYIESSDFSEDYDHVYVLYRDGEEVARQTSDSSKGEVRFSNVLLPEGVTSATFSIVCEFNGCTQPMSNSVSVSTLELPVQQTVSISDEGFFCYDENGATITVASQEEGVLYTLYLDGASTGLSHLGDATAESFTFDGLTDEGTYSVIASRPELERTETTCQTVMNDVYDVNMIVQPTDITASIQKSGETGMGTNELTLCLDETAQVFIRQPEFADDGSYDITYQLYIGDNFLANVDDYTNSPTYLSVDNITVTESGTYSISVKAIKTFYLPSGTTKECEILFEDLLTLTMLARPATGNENVVAQDGATEENPCYGMDIIVENPITDNTDIVYNLYLCDDDGNISGSALASICPSAGDDNRFTDIRNGYGVYTVVASNGVCEDVIGTVTIEQDKYAAVQTLDIDDNMCLGDPGVVARLEDSEANVTYTLYYVAPDDEAVSDLSNSTLVNSTPGTPLSSYSTTELHENVKFTNIDYNDGTPVSDLVSKDGYYYVIAIKTGADPACPVASPYVNFQTLKLPESFRLRETTTYCDEQGAQIFLESSEDDPQSTITYVLYSVDDAGNYTWQAEVISTGEDSLYFDGYFTAGKYTAIALKEYSNGHICTSSLEGYVYITATDPISTTFSSQELSVCENDAASFSISAADLTAGATYYVTAGEDSSPETSSYKSKIFNGTEETLEFSGLADGINNVWASYDNFDCLVLLGTVTVNRNKMPNATFQALEFDICSGESATLTLSASLAGASYYITINDETEPLEGTEVTGNDDGSALTWTVPTAETEVIYHLHASLDNCTWGDDEWEPVSIDYSQKVKPNGYLSLFINGVEYTSESTDIPTVCPGTTINVIANVEGATVATYYFYRSIDGEEKELRQDGASRNFIPYYSDEGISGEITVSFSITTNGGCPFDMDDAITFTLINNLAEEQHLVAQGGEYEYCASEVDGVKLGYINYAKSGETYRLYKVNEELGHDELVDIQEIPDYDDSFAETDTLFFSGWGYGADGADYAPAGQYYVMVSTADGCELKTNIVTVTEIPSPISDSDVIFYASATSDGSYDDSDTSIQSGDLGGYIVFRTAVPGVTYSLMKDGTVVATQTVDSECDLTFGPIVAENVSSSFNFGEGTYTILADNNVCSDEIGTITITGQSELNLDYELSASRACDDIVTITQLGSELGVTYTLYAVTSDQTTEIGSNIGDGSELTWQVSYDSNVSYYKVTATLGEVGPLDLYNRVNRSALRYRELYAYFEATDYNPCSSTEDLVLTVKDTEVGVTYYITANGETVEGFEQQGNGAELYWYPDKADVSVTYVLNAYQDSCEWLGLDEMTIEAGNLTANITLYIQGEGYDPSSTEIPSVCLGTNVSIVATVTNSAGNTVTASSYKFFRSIVGGDEESQVLQTNTYYPTQDDATGTMTVYYKADTYSGCSATSDPITFTIFDGDGNNDGIEHLVAVDSLYAYCYGDDGVRLAYVNSAEKGNIYRLYRVDDEDTGHDELVDIQEIPDYDDDFLSTDTLYFSGWGYGSLSNYASAGQYYVISTDSKGCRMRTDTVTIIENPLPAADTDSVFYAAVYYGVVDDNTANTNYGVIGGSLVYRTAVPDVHYYLLKDDSVMCYATVTEPQDLIFGPIQEQVIVTTDGLVEYRDEIHGISGNYDIGGYYNVGDTLRTGEGTYTILAVDDSTGCDIPVGNVVFVDEELIAYNVEIYLNKDVMTKTISLTPAYGYKGNHLYIDWSTKIDKVYLPSVEVGSSGYYVTNEQATAELNYNASSGYTTLRGKLDDKGNYVNQGDNYSNIWFEIIEDTTITGTYGLINVDYTTNDASQVDYLQPTGWFTYTKPSSSYYGRQEIQYLIENKAMAGRTSNIATITILCGNESTGDSSSVFLIPNAFSPNGDGFNDVFKIIIPDKYEDNSESRLTVFNRWGTQVYRSSGLKYGENNDWWDGTSSSSNMVTLGEKLPSGTYYYVFTITFIDKQHNHQGSTRKMHGYVELRR